ncbi:MAG: ribosome small subunit-dependent GTPase A [Ferruginibacter sp.]|nr:ribosome small subunit-dependent GTPase A [Chitinophagaceae bacterium]MBP6286756.1 ribosome small subunit-dependent GTPase A [Ferruginibacter sp.]MBU9936915.1 ribosome small subunit-dependent GTPase A [Ferruginibacter sp.]
MNAIVYKSTGSWYIVKDGSGKQYTARILGKFKIEGFTSTNPIAVGDKVTIETENELEDSVTITEIADRKNYINRTSPANKHQHHIIASNLDQSLLFATLKDPKTSQGFIDRFLVASEAYHVPAVIVFNKADLYKKKELEKFAELRATYEKTGYTVLLTSVETGEGIEAVKALLKDKVTLLSGHSGVGKSSFINKVFPELNIKTQDVSGWSGKGLHTTTFAEMFDLPGGGKIIDTPGIRELGLVDISRQELSHYFPEMRALINNCQFNNCMHLNEPGCAVKAAVEEGAIHIDRYISYCNILETINEKHY